MPQEEAECSCPKKELTEKKKKIMENRRKRKYVLFPVAQIARNLTPHDLGIQN